MGTEEEADEGKRKNILFPIKIDEVVLPFGFRNMHAADLTDWEGTGSHAGFKRFFGDGSSVLGLSQGAWEEK